MSAMPGESDILQPSSTADLDLQDAAGLVAVCLTPGSDGQEPVVSLEMVGRQKRYARVWLRKPCRVEWGWSLPEGSRLLWRGNGPGHG